MSHDPRTDKTYRDKASSTLKNVQYGKNKPAPQCVRVQAQLLEYLDGSVSDRERQALRTHLDGCDRCRQELALFQQSEQALRGALQTAPPAGDLRAAFYARLASETAPRASRRAKLNWRLAVPALATCGLLMGWLSVPHSPHTALNMTHTGRENQIARVEPQHSGAVVSGDTPRNNRPDLRLKQHTASAIATVSGNMRRSSQTAQPVSPVRASKRIALNGVPIPPLQIGRRQSARSASVKYLSAKAETRIKPVAVLVAGVARHKQMASHEALRDALVKLSYSAKTNMQKSATNSFAYDAGGKVRSLQTNITPDHYALALSTGTRLKTQSENLPSLNGLVPNQTYGEFAKAPVSSMAAGDSVDTRLKSSLEDNGIAIQVRDSRRGFTSSMRLASQVQQRDGKQVLTIHVEDDDAPSPSAETSPSLPGEVRMDPE